MNWIKVDEEIFDHVGKRKSEGDSALYGQVAYEMMESYFRQVFTERSPH